MKMRQSKENSSISTLLRVRELLILIGLLSYGQLVFAGSLAFSSSSYSVAENSGTVTITVNRSGSTAAAATVTVVSENGTAGAADFDSVSQSLSWGIGDSAAKTFTVAIKDDEIVETTESLTLKFTAATGDGTGGNATINITDYEEGKLQFSASTFSGQENSLQVIATISRVSGTNGPATVKVKSSTTATSAASNTNDYNDVDTTISFANGESSKTVSVVLKNDNVAELSEFFELTLSSPTNAGLGTVKSTTVEIKDADLDFTSTLKLLTKTVDNITQPKLVDLTQNSILDSKKKTLDLVNTIPILTLTELEAKQDPDGLMTIDVETDRVYLRPIAIKRSSAGATPNINVRDDINSTFSTSYVCFAQDKFTQNVTKRICRVVVLTAPLNFQYQNAVNRRCCPKKFSI